MSIPTSAKPRSRGLRVAVAGLAAAAATLSFLPTPASAARAINSGGNVAYIDYPKAGCGNPIAISPHGNWAEGSLFLRCGPGAGRNTVFRVVVVCETYVGTGGKRNAVGAWASAGRGEASTAKCNWNEVMRSGHYQWATA